MKEIIIYFLRLGLTGFGGPVALVAQMQTDLIEKRKWMNADDFAAALALIKSMPGPLAFSTASFLGYQKGRFWGGIAAGVCLVLPAFCMMLGLAMSYDSFKQIRWVEPLLKGMQSGALAIIAASILSLAKPYYKSPLFLPMTVLTGVLILLGYPEPILILGFGLLSIWLKRTFKGRTFQGFFPALGPALGDPKILKMAWICFKSGAFVFGTGLAMVPLLEDGFVNKNLWMTHSQFLDALAFGQMTPGPVLITVTFVGYKVAGLGGALVATFCIFSPAAFHMTTWFPRALNWLKAQTWIKNFIFGAMAGVIGSLVVVCFKLSQDGDWKQTSLTAIAFIATLRFRVPSWLLILSSGAAGLALLSI